MLSPVARQAVIAGCSHSQNGAAACITCKIRAVTAHC